MQKERLLASGGLNLDVEEYFLPKGDYIDAKNIVIDSGLNGGQGAIKKIEGVTSIGTYSGDIRAVIEEDSIIYFITRDSATARLYKLVDTTVTEVINYAHGASSAFDPVLKKIGDVLVWNYADAGTPLYWLTTRTQTGTQTISQLKLIKETPNFTLSVLKTINSAAENDVLSTNDFQFAMRYQYDSKEYSALSSFSKVYKAEPNIQKYVISHTISNKPSFVQDIFIYVRFGNNGTWRRIKTIDISSSNSISFDWNGDVYETLPDTISAKPFDAIPIDTKAIEVAENRILLGNNLDDYSLDNTNTIDISVLTNSGYQISTTNGSINTYLGNDVSDANDGINSSETSGDTHYHPFANNSSYEVGYAFYDDNMRTRGVEKSTTFKTGDFAYGSNGIVPTIKLTFSNNDVSTCFPSWAKYVQVLYSKNLSKSYIFEGYASAFWFELEEEGLADPLFSGQTRSTFETRRVLKLDLNASDTKNIKYLVVDTMSMFRTGKVYTYSEGDRMRINLVASSSASNNIVDMKILGQSGSLIFCEYNLGAIDLSNAYSYQEKNFFEIYSPKQVVEEENRVFFEGGHLIPISTFVDNTTSYYISQDGTNSSISGQQPNGDMMFEKVELVEYTEAPFSDVVTVSNSHNENQEIEVECNRQLQQFVTSNQSNAVSSSFSTFSNFITNEDNATISSDSLGVKLTNSYLKTNQETSDTIKLVDGTATLTLSVSNGTASNVDITGTIELYHVQGSTETKIGTDKTININSATTSSVDFGSSNHTFGNLHTSGINRDFNYDDVLKVKLELDITMDITSGGFATVIFNTSGDPLHLQFKGDQSPVTRTIEFDNNAGVGGEDDYLIRTISKSEKNPQWNTSAGKPNIEITSNVVSRKKHNIRYGGKYIQGTNVNEISSFFFLNEKEVPEENGAINVLQRTSKLQTEGQVVLALCDDETSSIYLNENIIVDGGGNSLIASSGKFLGSIRNLKGGFGCSDNDSVVEYRGNVYWWDQNKKKVVRYNRNGLVPISDIGMKSYFSGQENPPLSCYILPSYDMVVVDFGDAEAVGFSERNNRWISKFNGRVERGVVKTSSDIKNTSGSAIKYSEQAIFFGTISGTGKIKGESSAKYNSYFLEDSTNAHIQFVLNTPTPIVLENVTISQAGADFVDYTQSNNLRTSTFDIDFNNENGQTSKVKDINCLLENKYIYGHVMRDSNSAGGIINGDYMVGSTNKVKLTLTDGNDDRDYKINLISIGYNPSSGHNL